MRTRIPRGGHPVYDQPDTSTGNSTIYRSVVNEYYCPTRRAPQAYSNQAKIDYAGRAGSGGSDGALVRRVVNPINLAAIQDGTANTILVGEKQLNRTKLSQTYDDNEPYMAPGWDNEIFRLGSASEPPGPDTAHPSFTNADPLVGSNRFGSCHPGTFNAALVHGSVRGILFTVDTEVFRRLCVRNDGQPVTLP